MQIVGYNPSNPREPHSPATLTLATDEQTIEHLPLTPGAVLQYALTERHCVGSFPTSTTHKPCSHSTAPYCPTHQDRWACAICRGDCSKPLDSCDEQHAIYLAAFAPAIFKVGVTRSWRLLTRLTEQGADEAVHLETTSDGRLARQRERELSSTTMLRERIPTAQKQAGLHRVVDSDKWTRVLEEYPYRERFSFEYGFEVETKPLVDVVLTGTIVGTKGRILIVDRGGTQYSVDMRELLGYELAEHADTKKRQSSFGSF